MERTVDDLASEALRLNLEGLWVEEASRRYQQLKAGTARSIASEEVFARLDARNPKRPEAVVR
jgi:hypothetical protein